MSKNKLPERGHNTSADREEHGGSGLGASFCSSSLDLFADYVEGKDCTCSAYGECECGCGADWTPKVEKLVEAWRDMTAAEMRLRCGEMTAQEIRTVRAVLSQILPANVKG